MGSEENHRRQEREQMVKNAMEFSKQMGNQPSEHKVREEVYSICDRVEKKIDRNIRDPKDRPKK